MERQEKSGIRQKSTPKRKKTLQAPLSYPKITLYMSPPNTKQGVSNTASKFESLDVTVTKSKKQTKRSQRNSRKTSLLPTTVIPSFEKIVADRKRFKKDKENVKLLDVFDERLLDDSLIKYQFAETKVSENLLDCKYLSFERLDEAFEKNLPTLRGIMNGTVVSHRHNQYKKAKWGTLCGELHTSNSIPVFTQEQHEYMLDLMTRRLDPENQIVSYVFKVLWPELCFRIFMDEHKMTTGEALTYLDKRPIDM